MSLRLFGVVAALVLLVSQTVVTQNASPAARVDFARDVQPIFQQHCIGCHGPSQQMNGFRLDRRSVAFRGGTQAVIVAGNAPASRLYQRLVTSQFGNMMPPTAKLSAAEVAIVKAWIEQGADWPDALANEDDLPPLDQRAVHAVDVLRHGDFAAFKTAIDANRTLIDARGPDGGTPFMFAALYGDVALLRWLLERGGNPNARNDANATALMWVTDDPEKVRLLVEAGADVNVMSSDGRTALGIAASQARSTPIVEYLLDHGADVNPRTRSQADPTPLRLAATAGSPENMQLLIARGANVRAAGAPALIQSLLHGCQKCFELVVDSADTRALNQALLATAVLGDVRSVQMMLDRGADVNAADADGRTALIYAASSDEIPVDLVTFLLERGANVHARTGDGLTAVELAGRHGNTAIGRLLRARGRPSPVPSHAPAPASVPRNTIDAAIARSIPLLQKADADFSRNTGCQSCHNDSLTAMTIDVVRQKGFAVDAPAVAQELSVTRKMTSVYNDRHLQATSQGGGAATVAYILMGLHAQDHTADLMTDAAARFLKLRQLGDGRWTFLGHTCSRPPLCSGDVQQTALAIRALQLYAPSPGKAEYDAAIHRGGEWLARSDATTNDERAFRVLGLTWANAAPAVRRAAVEELIKAQRGDGGWSDIASLESTAYATGLALNALHAAGEPSSSPAYRKGVEYLLRTQRPDGSWYVKSRSLGIQPYFDNGFPHGKDQWISSAATNWATMALAHAAKSTPRTSERRD